MASNLPQFTNLPIYLSRVDGGLQRRIETLKRGLGANARILFLLSDGEARIEGRGDEVHLSGPSIAWRQTAGDFRLIIEPGSSGYIAEIAEETLVRAIGDFLESAALHALFDRDWTRSFETDAASHHSVQNRLDSILEELAQPQAASAMMIRRPFADYSGDDHPRRWHRRGRFGDLWQQCALSAAVPPVARSRIPCPPSCGPLRPRTRDYP